MMKQYFLPYQKRWILDNSPMKLYAKSRRIGISYATSYRVNDKCLRRGGFVQWVTSRDEFTAREFVTEYVSKWARAANAVCRGINGNDVELVDELHGIRAFTVTYGNGSRVVSLSSTPEAFAGKGGDILIDEADLHRDSGRVIDMALPCTTWGGQLEMVSALSVYGSAGSPFCRMLREAESGKNPMGWSVHRTTIADAVREGFVERLNEVTGSHYGREEWLEQMRGRCRTDEAWQTQYLIQPGSDGKALLSYDLIRGCELSRGELAELCGNEDRSLRFGGYDVGRKKDLAVYYEFIRSGDVLIQSDYQVLDRASFGEQREMLRERLKDGRLARLCMDATGMGMMLTEELQEEFGEYRVEAVTFTAPVKSMLAMPMKAMFEGQRVRIEEEDELRNDLHKIVKSVTAAGNVRYDAERDEDGHSDRFWAMALAIHAAGGGGSGETYYAKAEALEPNRGRQEMKSWRW